MRTLGGGAVALFLLPLLAGCHGGSQAANPTPGAVERPGGNTVALRDTLHDVSLQMEELIRKRVTGVDVSRSGSALQLHLRGAQITAGGSDVLVVVDGVELQNASMLLGVNPADVQRLELLRDASAAMYGARGHNGVLLVTTRRSQ